MAIRKPAINKYLCRGREEYLVLQDLVILLDAPFDHAKVTQAVNYHFMEERAPKLLTGIKDLEVMLLDMEHLSVFNTWLSTFSDGATYNWMGVIERMYREIIYLAETSPEILYLRYGDGSRDTLATLGKIPRFDPITRNFMEGVFDYIERMLVAEAKLMNKKDKTK